MSTRAIINVTDGRRTLRLRKHCDGYPSDTLDVIKDGLATKPADAQTCADTLLEQSPRHEGRFGGLCLEQITYGDFTPDTLGCQFDLEWIYVVDLDAKVIRIYGGRYADCSPQEHYERGMVDYDDDDDVSDDVLAGLTRLGYTINSSERD